MIWSFTASLISPFILSSYSPLFPFSGIADTLPPQGICTCSLVWVPSSPVSYIATFLTSFPQVLTQKAFYFEAFLFTILFNPSTLPNPFLYFFLLYISPCVCVICIYKCVCVHNLFCSLSSFRRNINLMKANDFCLFGSLMDSQHPVEYLANHYIP